MRLLWTKIQRDLLGIFFTNPHRAFYMGEIGRILCKKPGVFQRTLGTFARDGILTSEYRANARYFKVNPKHPLYHEFSGIVSKICGVEGILRDFFSGVAGVEKAFVYGSFAKQAQRQDSDVDVLVVGKRGTEELLLRKIPGLEKKLQREIHYKFYSLNEFSKKIRGKDPFIEEVMKERKIMLKGGNRDV